MGENLTLFGNQLLRTAIRENRVSFPAQMPVFAKQREGEVQWRIAHLYFVRGWSMADLAARFSLNKEMTRRTIDSWRVRAISSGYIQEIDCDCDLHPCADHSPSRQYAGSIEDKSVNIARGTVAFVARASTSARSTSNGVRAMLLEQIEAGARSAPAWPGYCLRLLRILKDECVRLEFYGTSAQIARIDIEKIDADVARDLLRDLRVRLSDEEAASSSWRSAENYSRGLLQALVLELRMALGSDGVATWPPYCLALLDAVREGCSQRVLRLALAQLNRIEGPVSNDPRQSEALLRDLSHRIEDDFECKQSFNLPLIAPSQFVAGAAR
jgi:hypothetical protein